MTTELKHETTPAQPTTPWWLSLLPETRLLWWVGVLAVLGLVPAFFPMVSDVWAMLAVLVGGLVGWDAWRVWRLARARPLAVVRQVSANIPLGVATRVTLLLHAAEGAKTADMHVMLHDWHPAHTTADFARQTWRIHTGKHYRMRYHITALQRGNAQFNGVEAHFLSRLGFWRWRSLLPVVTHTRVLPNFARIAHYRLLATANRLSDMGVLRVQRRGQGTEFDHLRDFRDGDSMRQVHWQASSAQNRLIAKEYQAERDQQIIFMLDVSRRMWHQDSQESLLDEALNSAILLAHVAANQGDAVGMMSMGVHTRWSAPRKGAQAVAQLMNQFYDVQPEAQAVDYLAAAQQLLARHKKRSLIVVLTNTRNDDFSDVQRALHLLREKHLVILADIRERALQEHIEEPISDMDHAVAFHAAQDYLNQRWQQHKQLRHQGMWVLDVEAQELPLKLVSQYWQLKQSERF